MADRRAGGYVDRGDGKGWVLDKDPPAPAPKERPRKPLSQGTQGSAWGQPPKDEVPEQPKAQPKKGKPENPHLDAADAALDVADAALKDKGLPEEPHLAAAEAATDKADAALKDHDDALDDEKTPTRKTPAKKKASAKKTPKK